MPKRRTHDKDHEAGGALQALGAPLPSAQPVSDNASLSTHLLHELRNHQTELQMQNEELLRSWEELASARARYYELYESAPVGYCTLSEKGLLLEVNRTATEMLGTQRGTLVKQPLTRYILPDDQDTYYLHRRKLLATELPQTCELRLTRPDGKTFWARLEATVGRFRGDPPVSRVVISDITERKRTEQALQESRDALEERVARRTQELQEKNAALEREFSERRKAEERLQQGEERFRTALAEAADKEREKLKRDLHDGVCQQLTGLGFLAAKLAADLGALHHAEAATATEIGAIARSTARMAHDIGVELSPISEDPSGLHTAIEELALRASRLHGIRCRAVPGEPVRIDNRKTASHLYLIAQEAVSNAARHSGSPEIRVQLTRQGSAIVLTVSDSGTGMPEKPAENSGIGIEVMHSRARLIGAELNIAPGPDGGTTVTCTCRATTGS